jgi:hypothetical protein
VPLNPNNQELQRFMVAKPDAPRFFRLGEACPIPCHLVEVNRHFWFKPADGLPLWTAKQHIISSLLK